MTSGADRSSGLRRRLGGVAVVAALVGLLTACNPDPTTGKPPAVGATVPAFTFSQHAVGPGTQWSLAGSWYPGCPVPREHLRLVRVSHWGYDGRPKQGALVVHHTVVPGVERVFRTLYANRFQINRMQGVGAFGGSDAKSMAANNTSAFNCRKIAGSSTWSEHAFGTAIDINPVQNPYVKGGVIDPPAGRLWLDRNKATPGLVRDGDAVVRAFADGGFKWGGHWRNSKDYQHFSTSGR